MNPLHGSWLEMNPDEISSTHHDLTDFSEAYLIEKLEALHVDQRPRMHLFYRHDRAKGNYEHLIISRGSYVRFEIIYDRWEANTPIEKKVLTSSDAPAKDFVPALYFRQNNGETYRERWNRSVSAPTLLIVVNYFIAHGTIDRKLDWVETY